MRLTKTKKNVYFILEARIGWLLLSQPVMAMDRAHVFKIKLPAEPTTDLTLPVVFLRNMPS